MSCGSSRGPEIIRGRQQCDVCIVGSGAGGGMSAKVLAEADERSGSANDAGVPEFMDFMMIDQPERQVAMRGGLAWIDHQAQERFGQSFVDCISMQREQLLDDTAWPERASRELRHGVAFSNAFRDLTATGFWTSKMGVEDLQYMGNEYVSRWSGCPPEQLRKLGLID